MATRTTIQNLINNFIRNKTPKVVKAEHADVEDALLSNSYATIINDTHLSNTITERNPDYPFLEYNIYFAKQGRKVSIKGTIRNNSSNIVGFADYYFFQITDPEYLQNTSIVNVTSLTFSDSTDQIVQMFLSGNKLITDLIPALEIVNLDFEYLTEN